MKTAVVLVFLMGSIAAAQTAATEPPACAKCAASAATAKPIPGSSEKMVVGKIENLIPIGVLAVLGCEKCSAEAVSWAIQQGSSFEDVDRTLSTLVAMQKLDCFKAQFGPEVVARIEKPIVAAKEALIQARARAAK